MKKPAAVLPWVPVEFTEDETRAFKALNAGNASEGQQKVALNLILYKICRTYDLSFRPDSERATSFAEGKRHVGMQIVKQINLVMPERRGG